jgi:hypothetical protein
MMMGENHRSAKADLLEHFWGIVSRKKTARYRRRSTSVRAKTPWATPPCNGGYSAQKQNRREQARQLMRTVGNDRDRLNEAVAKLFRK